MAVYIAIATMCIYNGSGKYLEWLKNEIEKALKIKVYLIQKKTAIRRWSNIEKFIEIFKSGHPKLIDKFKSLKFKCLSI